MGSGAAVRAAGSILAALLLCAVSLDAEACSTCGCTLNTDLGNQGVEGGKGWRLEFRYDLVDQTELRKGSASVSVPLPATQEVEHRTRNAYYDLGVDYGFSRAWGLNLQLPFVGRLHSTYDTGDTKLSTSDYKRDLGDVKLTGRYTGFSPDMSSGLLMGLKLPTGATDERFATGPDAGLLLDPTLQPGSGTTDLLLGGYHFDELGASLGDFVQVTYQHALGQHRGYAPGDSANLNAGLRWYWSDYLTGQLQFNYQLRARDRGEVADAADTGGRVLYLSPGITFTAGYGWHAFAFLQVPVHQYVDGLQLTPRRIFSVGASYSFH